MVECHLYFLRIINLTEDSIMHTVPVERRIFLGALVALALLAGALFASTPKASAEKSQCSLHTICIWEGSNFTGVFHHFSEEPGCYNKERWPFKSGWNRGNHNVEFGNHKGLVSPGESFSTNGTGFEGLLCVR